MRSFKFNLNVLNVFLAIALVLTVAVRLSTIDANAVNDW